MGSLSQFEENVGPLLRGHLSAGKGIRGIGFFEGVKNADYFLHSFILLWFPPMAGQYPQHQYPQRRRWQFDPARRLRPGAFESQPIASLREGLFQESNRTCSRDAGIPSPGPERK